jgi:serine phosphatase RsbU (regulator of sigma subunit)
MSTTRIKIVSFFFLLFLPLWVHSQDQGKYFTQNFFPKEYHAAPQVWQFTQDIRGFIYFGTEDGVVEYDGVNWNLIRTANKSTVFSLAINDAGQTFVGAVGEIGYLAPDSVGNLNYISLLETLPEEDRDFGNAWCTNALNDAVYFQTAQKIIRWKNGESKVWNTPSAQNNSFGRSKVVNGKLYVSLSRKGLLVLENEKLEFIKGSEDFGTRAIRMIESYSGDKIIFGTLRSGMFLYDTNTGEFTPFVTEADAWLLTNKLYKSITIQNARTGEQNFVLATLDGGVVIIDKEGKKVQEINKKTGLNTNLVISLFLAKDKSLWLGLDNGVARVDINSPITLWDEDTGLQGKTVTSVFQYKGVVYITNDDGVNYFDKETNKFNVIEGINNTGWKMFVFTTPSGETKLLAGASNGIYEIKYNVAIPIALGGGSAQVFYNSDIYPDRIFIGGGNGIRTIRYNQEENIWVKEGAMPGFHHALIKSIVEKDSVFWAATDHQGVLKLTFENITSHDRLIIKTNITYDEKKGLPSVSKNNVFKLKNNSFLKDELLITTEGGAYTYSSTEDKMIPSTIFGERYRANKLAITNAYEAGNGDIWLNLKDIKSNRDKVERAILQSDGTYLIDSLSYRELNGRVAETTYVKDNIFWLPTGDGVFQYDINFAANQQNNDVSFSTIIRDVSLAKTHQSIFHGAYYDDTNPELVSKKQPTSLKPIIEYKDNSISFVYSAPTFNQEKQTVYSYFLEGHDDDWSPWRNNSKKEYTNLSESKDYVFRVKAKNIHGFVSEEAAFAFEVLPPWYRTLWAYIMYGIVGVLVLVGMLKLNSARYKGEKVRLESVITDRTQEVVNQNEQIEAKNAYLQEQKREIAKQKDKIEESYQNVKLLSTLGQDIVATRSVEALTKKVYNDINALMDASGFGIGVYMPKTNTIEFRGFIEKGETLDLHEESAEDNSLLSIWCFKHARKIVINDLSKEIYRYIEDYKAPKHGEIPASLIYLPLIANDEVIGVITVQSFKKQAFNYYHVDIMENLATYVAISMDNTLLYENLEEKVEERTAEIERKTQVIEKKNALIEKKNSDITASINYAKRIQTALLPKIEKVQEVLAESFILFKPRDIISGDFYWFTEKDDKVIIAAVDCTGHGVPGAFMSMIGNDLLNESVNLLNIIDPAEILRHMHIGVRQALRQKETGNQDGMDMSICVIHQKEKFITFAGAKNPLVYMQDGQLYLIKGDKVAVGGRQREVKRTFTKHTIPIVKSTTCYLFTDGYQDQTGGPEGRKFMTRKFREFLHEIHFYSMEEQQQQLEKKLADWMGDKKQVDDILLIGFSTT